MFLHRSNHAERLVKELSEVLRRPLASPFAKHVIVVQSKGMERWLSLELSRELSVFANAEFPFPRHLLERIFDRVLGEEKAAARGFEQHALAWAIAALLPELLARPSFRELAEYLEGDADGALRLALSQRIARVFDDYSVYRPELLFAFERGAERSWEAELWQALVARLGPRHQAARARRLIAALREKKPGSFELPERLCLFGISSLPPLYVSVLAALSAHVELHCFLLSPCREYFGDTRKKSARASAAPEGHPLLASLGVLGREFQELLEESAAYRESEHDLYVELGEDSLLHALQSDILHLCDRGAARAPIASGDRSLEIHVCHGPMREVEVLHDQLCAILEETAIEPHEIAVLTPEIERYAQVIEAVFAQTGRPALPYSLADRGPRSTLEVVHALHALIDVSRSRMEASAVLDLLSFDCVRRRFEIASEELDRIRGWIDESGVRFCIDAAQRAEIGQPELPDNTFRDGLDRMLLGYALEGQGRRLYRGRLPFDPIEGSEAVLLGKLCEFCERLFRHCRALAEPAPIETLAQRVLALLAELIDENPANAREHELIRKALGSLCEQAEAGGFAEALSLRSLAVLLERALEERLPAHGLLARGISFCQLVPMRSIPFKVVCLLGMNDDVFPGKAPRLAFDRMNAERRLGDRNRRDDDRYMFLEALLSARERVIISYVGRGIHDNRVIPPSVVVDELLDAIDRGFFPEGTAELGPGPLRRAALERRLCVPQRLQAFSPRYFDASDDARLFSYSERDCEAARALGRPRSAPTPFDARLAHGATFDALTVDELCGAVTRPLRTFLQRRLGIHLGGEAAPLADREPMRLDGLDAWQLGTDLLGLALEGRELSQLFAAARARRVLPLGSVGENAYQQLVPELEALNAAALAQRNAPALAPLPIEIEIDGVRLVGTLNGLWPDAHLCASYSRVGRRFEFEHFVKHVVLNCALEREARAGYPRRSVVIARAEKSSEGVAEVAFAPIAEPERILASLIAVARAARERALPFVYEPAHAYAAELFSDAAKGSETAALERAHKRFEKDEELSSSEFQYTKLVFPSFTALLADSSEHGFCALARRLFEPFYACRSET